MFQTKQRSGGRTLAALLGAAVVATAMTTLAMAMPTGNGQNPMGFSATGDVQLATYRHHRHHYYRHHFRHHGYGYGFYRPYAYYNPPVYVRPSGCGWLKVRAIETGSRYWWQRYRDCRY